MSRVMIFTIYVVIDLLIVAGVLWAALVAHWPARQFFFPAILLFVMNGVWLLWMTVKNTPHGG